MLHMDCLRERCVCTAKLYSIEHYWAHLWQFLASATFLVSFDWTYGCKVVALLCFSSLCLSKLNFLARHPLQGHLRCSLHVCSPAGQWRPCWKATALAHWPPDLLQPPHASSLDQQILNQSVRVPALPESSFVVTVPVHAGQGTSLMAWVSGS